MSGGKGGQTIGFHYLFSILFGIGRGPIDELRAIKVGDKIAWEGNNCDGPGVINKPDLFGGEKKEGGVQGLFYLLQGAPDQVLPGSWSQTISGDGPYTDATLPDLKALVTSETGGLMGELRGRVCLWFDGLVTSMNPYIKTWKFRIRRAKAGWYNNACWYPAKAFIFLAEGKIFAMNPAHILYECCTNPVWGRGLPSSLIDDNSFRLAADTFCDEGFGLCLVWYRKEDISSFIQTVLDHVGAFLYTDRETGRVMLKPTRYDYDPNNLPTFTPSTGLIDITEDDTGSTDTSYNEVIVVGHDPITDEDIQMPSHNLAAFRAQGAPSSLSQTYKGLPTKDLCARVAQRDLRASAAGLRKFRVILDRRGFRIHPGAVFKVQFPERGIGSVILRAGEIDDGKLADGRIAIRAVQDVFGVPETAFVTSVPTTWTPPSETAVAAAAETLFEVGYRQAYLAKGETEANAVGAGDSYVSALAAKPSVRVNSYDLLSKVTGEADWRRNGEFYFAATATLAATVGATATSFVVENDVEFSTDVIGTAIMVGTEIMSVTDYVPGTKTVTVVRGCADTWPQTHVLGTRVWAMDDDPSSDGRLYAEGETVEAKVLTRSWSSAMDEADAALLSMEMNGRIARPFPPADVKVDDDSIYTLSGLHEEPTISFVERNRLTQADVLVGFFDGTVSPEVGTTYDIRVFDAVDAVAPIGTYTGIATGWQYTLASQIVDGADTLDRVWFELVSVRDTLESWEPYRFMVRLRTTLLALETGDFVVSEGGDTIVTEE